MSSWLGSGVCDIRLGIAEGVDNILAAGEIERYNLGIVGGYLSVYNYRILPRRIVRKHILAIQKENEKAFSALYKKKDPLAW